MKHIELSKSGLYSCRFDAHKRLTNSITDQSSNKLQALTLTFILQERKCPVHPSAVAQLTANTQPALLITEEILCRPPF